VLDARTLSLVTGLSGTYLVLSLIVLSLVEIISNVLSRRARFLRDGVINLIGAEMGAKVLNNPAVNSLGFIRPTGRATGLPSYIHSNLFARALLSELGNAKDEPSMRPVTELVDAVVGDSAVSIEEAERRLAVWFDSAMDRLSGAYKRNTQKVSLALAILVTLAANADSIHLLKELWNVSAPAAHLEVAVKEATTACQVDNKSPACHEQLAGFLKNVEHLPLGWDLDAVKQRDVRGWLLSLLGLALTVLAVSRGSPFWFDVLRRFSPGMSSSGPPPAPAPRATIIAAATPLPPPAAATVEPVPTH
jgi:hypothetical protein